MPKKQVIQEPQVFQIGETVKFLRPNLHFGCVGEVVAFRDGLHIVRIPTKHEMAVEKFWHGSSPGSQLEGWI